VVRFFCFAYASLRSSDKHIHTRLIRHFSLTFTLILAIGILSTIWVSVLDYCIKLMFHLRGIIACIPGDEIIRCDDVHSICACDETTGNLRRYFTNTNAFLWRWFVFTSWSTLLGCAGYWVTKTHGHVAAGSGIPRLKQILSGSQIHHFLSLRVLLIKSIAIVLSISSGLPIGREGPYVHLAACIAKLLMRLPLYRQRYGSSSSRRVDMLSIAAAAGISATFASPFGGIIFSVEIMSSYFTAEENLPRRFLAAFSGFFVIKMLHPTGYFSFLEIESAEISMTWSAAWMCIFIGLIGGVLSGIYIRFVSSLVRMRVRWSRKKHKNSFLTISTVVLLVLHSTVIFSIFQFLPDVRDRRLPIHVEQTQHTHTHTHTGTNTESIDLSSLFIGATVSGYESAYADIHVLGSNFSSLSYFAYTIWCFHASACEWFTFGSYHVRDYKVKIS
jgi:H+/Cl- antiporter ClcA